MYCTNCGTPLKGMEKFCPGCGQRLVAPQTTTVKHDNGKIIDFAKDAIDTVTNSVNEMTGGHGSVELHMRDLVSGVFVPHSKSEREDIFVAGTKNNTPLEKNISSQWPHPWLYSRVFLVLAVTYWGLLFMAKGFENPNAIPGMIFIGALAVPFSLLIFFFEMNAPRNISIFDVTTIFFVGGICSMLATLVLDGFFGIKVLNFSGAIIIGLTEEFAKALIIWFVLRDVKKKYILNGLLVGASIGAGFAAFETAGYILRYFLLKADIGLMVLYIRGIMALGTHAIWSAIVGGALVMTKDTKWDGMDCFTHPKFLTFFCMAVAFHAIWDMPFNLPMYGKFVGVLVVEWIVLLVIIHAGLRQISELAKSYL